MRHPDLPLVVALAAVGPAAGFQVQWTDDKKYTETNRRNNWCLRPNAWQGGGGYTSFQQALKGRNISVVMMSHQPEFVTYDQDTHRVHGGLMVDILDEVASRTGLSWHTTAAVVDQPNSTHESWDDWLGWAVSNYDMAIGDFAATALRMSKGYRFAFPFLDASPVLVGQVKVVQPPWYMSMMSWTRPFSWSLWLLVLFALVVTGYAFSVLEPSHCIIWKDPSTKRHNAFGHALYHTVAAVTCNERFRPRTTFGKIFAVTYSFSVLLLQAGYIASLAKVFVVEAKNSMKISSVQDAIKRNLPVCVWKGGAYDKFMRQRFPDLPVRYPSAEKWSYELVRNGYCVAMVKDSNLFRIDAGRKALNGGCDLGTIGNHLAQAYTTFVSRVDPSRCTDMLVDVVSAAMHNMYNDGWFHRRIEQFYGDVTDQSCEGSARSSHNLLGSGVRVRSFGGAFTLHALVTLPILVWVGLRWLRPQHTSRDAQSVPLTAPDGLRNRRGSLVDN